MYSWFTELKDGDVPELYEFTRREVDPKNSLYLTWFNFN